MTISSFMFSGTGCNLVKNMPTQFLKASSGKNCWKNSLLPTNSGKAERERPGRGGGNMEKCRKESPINHIAQINFIQGHTMHCASFGRKRA